MTSRDRPHPHEPLEESTAAPTPQKPTATHTRAGLAAIHRIAWDAPSDYLPLDEEKGLVVEASETAPYQDPAFREELLAAEIEAKSAVLGRIAIDQATLFAAVERFRSAALALQDEAGDDALLFALGAVGTVLGIFLDRCFPILRFLGTLGEGAMSAIETTTRHAKSGTEVAGTLLSPPGAAVDVTHAAQQIIAQTASLWKHAVSTQYGLSERLRIQIHETWLAAGGQKHRRRAIQKIQNLLAAEGLQPGNEDALFTSMLSTLRREIAVARCRRGDEPLTCATDRRLDPPPEK